MRKTHVQVLINLSMAWYKNHLLYQGNNVTLKKHGISVSSKWKHRFAPQNRTSLMASPFYSHPWPCLKHPGARFWWCSNLFSSILKISASILKKCCFKGFTKKKDMTYSWQIEGAQKSSTTLLSPSDPTFWFNGAAPALRLACLTVGHAQKKDKTLHLEEVFFWRSFINRMELIMQWPKKTSNI